MLVKGVVHILKRLDYSQTSKLLILTSVIFYPSYRGSVDFNFYEGANY